jgi:hypothetical protein
MLSRSYPMLTSEALHFKMPLKHKLIKLHKFQAVLVKVIFDISAYSCKNPSISMSADTSAA